MAELKPMEVIMRIDFVASDGEQMCAHAEKVQELIRCRECKHRYPSYCDVWSKYGTIQTSPDGYCHMAERRSDETD